MGNRFLSTSIAMRSSTLALFGLTTLAVSACRENPLVGRPNSAPVAVASIIGPDGQTVLEPLPAPTCAMPHPETLPRVASHTAKYDYTGTDITLTIDASKSHDDDGTITKFQWLSGTTIPDGGMGTLSAEVSGMTRHGGGRLVPEGQDSSWPED